MDEARALPEILLSEKAAAAQLLAEYFERRLQDGSGPYWSGSMFERFAGGGDAPAARYRFTADDLLAVSMLGVNVHPNAVLRILNDDAELLSDLLARIPVDLDLADASDDVIRPDSPAWLLWNHIDHYYRVGTTITSKLLARKRPRLLPVLDSHIVAAMGFQPGESWWAVLRDVLRRDNRALSAWLRDVRNLADVGEDISELRVLDILVWRVQQKEGIDARQRL